MKNIKKVLIILLIVLFSITLSYAAIDSDFYKIDKNKKMISRISPETDIATFKQKINVDKVYKSMSDRTEVTSGFVGTGMAAIDGQDVYELSVAGDFDGDGRATQLELSKIIRHIVCIQGGFLEGLYYESADLTGDGLVNQIDVTQYIRYIVFGELDLGKPNNKPDPKPDTTAPTVTLTTTEPTTSSVTATVDATDAETGIDENATYTFYIKEQGGEYVQQQNTTSKTCDFTGLKQNTTYTIKVEVEDKAGNKGSAEKTITTGTILDAGTTEGTITFGTVTWADGQASVGISTNTNYYIEYQVNGTSGTWTKATTPGANITATGLNHDDIVYVRLTDGTNAGQYTTIKIADMTAPTVTLTTTEPTTSSVTATANATDDETGIDKNATYTFYIKEQGGEYVQKQNTTSKTCDFTGLKQNTTYTIKVEVEDKAGNIGTAEKTITMGTIPDAGTTEGTITFGTVTWADGQASVGISTNTNYYIEYQVNGTSGTWTKAITPGASITATGLNHDDIVYARLTDGTNAGQYATLQIEDTAAPTVTLTTSGQTTSSVTATANATDAETGIDENATYTFYIKEQGGEYVQQQNTTSKTCDFTGLKQNTTYTIKVEVEDKAENIGTAEKTITIGTIPDAGTTEGAITFGTVTWADGQASVDISTNTNYYIEYQVNGTSGTWTKASTPGASITATGLNHDDIVYARLTDGTNAGQYATLQIEDTIAPEEFSITVTDVTETGCTVSGSTTDGQTGMKDYTYVAEPTAGGDLIKAEHITETTYAFTTLEEGKEYKIYMLAYDNAGNERKSNEVTITTNESNTEFKNAQDDSMFTKTENTKIQDNNGNPITIPAGFKIKVDNDTNNAKTVDKGIVIIDSSANEFVWVPVGTIYTDKEHTEENTKTIELNRYTFDNSGNPTERNDAAISFNSKSYEEIEASSYGNTTAKSIPDFKQSVEANKGFYIGRYEARKNNSGKITEKSTDTLYFKITQPNAATAARNMYNSTKPFVSDLINSYAWDTTTLFLQTFGTNPTYSRQKHIDSDPFDDGVALAEQGSNNKLIKDVQCNVYDMAGNATEWTTETCRDFDFSCVTRGGVFRNDNYTSMRLCINKASINTYEGNCFRPILYIKEKVEIPDAVKDGTITVSEVTWTDGKAQVTITTGTDYQIEYQKNGTGEGNWTKATGDGKTVIIADLNYNDIVYVRLTDGTNAGQYATLQIEDTAAPTVTLTTTEPTTSSVTATANATDDETEIDENATYTFYIKEENGEYVQKQNTTSKTCDFTGLKQNTTYTIKVEVEDKAGNKGSAEKTITTAGVPNAVKDGTITVSEVTWTDGKAQVTITTGTDYQIEYQKNGTGDGSWTKATGDGKTVTIGELEHNDIVYARLTDGTNAGQYTTIEIADATAPTVTLTTSGQTTSSVTATANATDDETGIDENATYTFYIKEGNGEYVQKQNTTSKTCDFTGLKQNTTYTIKVEVEDKAGNIGEATKEITTAGVPNAVKDGTITVSEVTWTDGKAQVTITTGTDYQIEYQKNGTGEGNWTKATGDGKTVTIGELDHNDILYARLTDGTNAGQYTTIEIADTAAPTVTLTTTEPTTSSVTATVNATDDETGIAEDVTYTFYIKEENGEYVQKQNTTSKTCDFTGLKQNTTYTIKVEVEDKAGNIGEATKEITTAGVPEAVKDGTITVSEVAWTDGKAQVTITTGTDYQIEYQINGTGEGNWTKATGEGKTVTIGELDHNDILYARLTDGTNAGQYTTIEIADAEKPEEFSITVTDVTETGCTVSGSTTDGQTGMKDYTYVAEPTAGGDLIKAEHTTETTYAFTTLEEGKEYKIYMKAYDNAGNERKSNEETITTKKVEIQVTEPIVVTSMTSVTPVQDNQYARGTTLYIKFSATIDGQNCTIINKEDEGTVPYAITKNGTYSFIASGEYNGKTITKEIDVVVNAYEKPTGVVQYDAGDWTQDEIDELKKQKLYDINKEHTSERSTCKILDENGANLTFGGFTYKGDTENSDAIDSGAVVTSRNQSVQPEVYTVPQWGDISGSPKFDGWQVFETIEKDGKTFVTKLIHAGSPENFVYTRGNSTSSIYAYEAEYILSKGERQQEFSTINGIKLSPRNLDMYKDKELDAKGYIKEVHLMNVEEAINAAPDVSLNTTTNGIRNTGGAYWLSEKQKNVSSLNSVQKNGSGACWISYAAIGIRPVITMSEGVYIASGTGTEEDPYILGRTENTVPAAVKDGTITVSEVTWADGKAQVTITTGTDYQIEYQKNGTGDGNWTKATGDGKTATIGELDHNDILYARLTDGIYGGQYTTIEIADAEKPEEFSITVTDVTETGCTVSGSTTDGQTGMKDYTYVAEPTAGGDPIKAEHITDTTYAFTTLEEGTEYKIYMIAYDNAGNERKSNEETITTKKVEIQVTEPIVSTDTSATSSTASNTVAKGTPVYIKFTATLSVAGGTCTIDKTIPYQVSSNGTYTFTVTGTYGSKTITKEIEVKVDQYQSATGLVQYDAGDWTEEEIQSLQTAGLYNLNASKTASSETGLNFTFGGFTYKGDTANATNISNGTIITSRNQSVAPESGYGTPKYDGWQILESHEENNKTYVTKLVHAGCPENFVYYYKTSNDAYRAEYILSSGLRQTSYNTYNPRSWDTYKDKSQLNLIEDVHCMTYDEAKAITGNTSNTTGIRNTGSYYWLGPAYYDNYLWSVRGNGDIGGGNGHCWGVRPVVSLKSGVYIERGSGVEEDPYILGKTENTVPAAVKDGTITVSEVTWADGKAQVTITTGTDYQIEYKKNGTGEGNWTKATGDGKTATIGELDHNDILYARLTDGIYGGQYATIEIVDAEKPEEFTMTVTDITETGCTVSGSTTDGQTGMKDYTYVAEPTESGDPIKAEHITDTTYAFTTLEEGTEYKIYMIAYDNAENERKSNEETITTATLGQKNAKEVLQIDPTATEPGKRSPYVKYNDLNCRVLYNDETHGLQLITNGCVRNESLGIQDDSVSTSDFSYSGTASVDNNFIQSAASYNNLVNTLNKKAKAYMDSNGIATDARCLGSNPIINSNFKFSTDSTTTYWAGTQNYLTKYSWNYKFKNSDTNYEEDVNQINNLGLNVNEGDTWLASRMEVVEESGYTALGPRYLDSDGKMRSTVLVTIFSDGVTFPGNASNGLRAVFHISSDAKITSGNGDTIESAYIIEK